MITEKEKKTGTHFEIRLSKSVEYYFVLIAKNSEVICTSQMYESKQSCFKGIRSVKWNAIFAEIIDKT